MMSRYCFLLPLMLLLFLTACGHRDIPPEVTALYQFPRAPVIPQKKQIIIVDAGHGGKDGGATSKRERYEEKELTLKTAFLVSDYLKQAGYQTILTRNHDIYIPLETRAEIANSVDADLFVSIHYNYSANQEAEGIEVFYYKEGKESPSKRIIQSKELALDVLKKMVLNSGAESRGVKPADFAVVRQTKMPAILVEAGFLSNPREREKLRDQKYLQVVAKGIAHGIDHYLTSRRK
jgi:N-acetylmuramoyl-L-alanine amidase